MDGEREFASIVEYHVRLRVCNCINNYIAYKFIIYLRIYIFFQEYIVEFLYKEFKFSCKICDNYYILSYFNLARTS